CDCQQQPAELLQTGKKQESEGDGTGGQRVVTGESLIRRVRNQLQHVVGDKWPGLDIQVTDDQGQHKTQRQAGGKAKKCPEVAPAQCPGQPDCGAEEDAVNQLLGAKHHGRIQQGVVAGPAVDCQE